MGKELGTSRVDLSDLATAIRNTLLGGAKYHGRNFCIGTLKQYTADETAAIWTKALGRPIQPQYATPEVLEEYETTMRGFMSPAEARSLKMVSCQTEFLKT